MLRQCKCLVRVTGSLVAGHQLGSRGLGRQSDASSFSTGFGTFLLPGPFAFEVTHVSTLWGIKSGHRCEGSLGSKRMVRPRGGCLGPACAELATCLEKKITCGPIQTAVVDTVMYFLLTLFFFFARACLLFTLLRAHYNGSCEFCYNVIRGPGQPKRPWRGRTPRD